MAVMWRTDNARRYRPAWGDRPARSGNNAPYFCQVAGCDSASYVVVRTSEHITVVCLDHADSLYADYGYVFISEVSGESDHE